MNITIQFTKADAIGDGPSKIEGLVLADVSFTLPIPGHESELQVLCPFPEKHAGTALGSIAMIQQLEQILGEAIGQLRALHRRVARGQVGRMEITIHDANN